MTNAPGRLALLVVALAAAGCGYARQCTVPDAPLTPPPGPPLPARVGVAYPDELRTRSLQVALAESSWAFPVGPAAISTFNQAAGQLFASPVAAGEPAPAPGGPEAVLTFTLEEARLRPHLFQGEGAEVRATAALRDARGEVARATGSASVEGQPAHPFTWYQCDTAGAALAAALASAASQARDALGASPAVAAWVRHPDRAPPPEGGPAEPLPAPPQPPASERAHRLMVVPRYLELDAVQGNAWSHAPGLGRVSGAGWGIRMAWDLTEEVALGLHGASTYVRVDYSPNPADPRAPAENGFFGAELQWRPWPRQRVRPWISLTGAYQGVIWSTYAYSVAGWSLLASAGVDVAVGSLGAIRLGVTGSAYDGETSSGIGGAGTPGPGQEGWSTGVRSLWFGAGWVFDLGPAR